MDRRGNLIAGAIVSMLAMGAIVALIVVAARRTPPATLTHPTWTLTRLVIDGQQQPLSPAHPATLQFGAVNDQVSGSGGCNTFGGSYALHGNQVQFGALRSTLIGCVDAVAGAQEHAYFQALSRVQTYQIVGTTLTLTSEGGEVQLTFRAS
jgi:heat shock protein HslJ